MHHKDEQNIKFSFSYVLVNSLRPEAVSYEEPLILRSSKLIASETSGRLVDTPVTLALSGHPESAVQNALDESGVRVMVQQRVARFQSPSDGVDDLTVPRRVIEHFHLKAAPWGRVIHQERGVIEWRRCRTRVLHQLVRSPDAFLAQEEGAVLGRTPDALESLHLQLDTEVPLTGYGFEQVAGENSLEGDSAREREGIQYCYSGLVDSP